MIFRRWREKTYRYRDLKWRGTFLKADIYRSLAEVGRTVQKPELITGQWQIEQSRSHVQLATEPGTGKITDSGYDRMAVWYTVLPGNYDIEFCAQISVKRAPGLKYPTFQEGFGLFARDTMEADGPTGLHYSNMVAAGAYFGTYNLWARDGITYDSVENVRNTYLKCLAKDAGCPVPYSGIATEADICLRITGNTISCRIADVEGRDLINKEGHIYFNRDSLLERDRDRIYLGFMAAGGWSVSVKKDSVKVRLSQYNNSYPPEEDTEKTPEIIQKTESDSCDICSFVKDRLEDGTIIIKPGNYYPKADIVLGNNGDFSDKPKHIKAEGAVLDFAETGHTLIIEGDNWIIEGLSLTKGKGFIIRGSHNHLKKCRAYNNQETGFLISAQSINIQEENWPSYNIIEDCLSYENSDPSGHNADGFACKVAAGEGNAFIRCSAFLNTDDGFDLFTKNRDIGAVRLIRCLSAANGYRINDEGINEATEGNGNGFKLGGCARAISHSLTGCKAIGNRGSGFTSNSNPILILKDCIAANNKGENIEYYFSGNGLRAEKSIDNCKDADMQEFDLSRWMQDNIHL